MKTLKTTIVAGAILTSLSFSQISVAGHHDATDHSDTIGYDKQQEDQNKLVGMGGMAAIGAGVGGPVGAVVGGIMGLMIGENVNEEKRSEDLHAKLQSQDQALDSVEAKYLALQNEHMATLVALKQLENQYQQVQSSQVQLAAMQKETAPVDLTELLNSEANIQFKTASYQLEQHYVEQLDKVAEQLKADAKMVVQLFGYADRRGEENYNLTLSEKRADQVKRYLVSKGVNVAQIETAGYGEAQPVTVKQTWENDFFDRRVVVRLTSEDAVMTAKQ